MACAVGPELIFTVFLEGDKAQRTTGFGYQRRETQFALQEALQENEGPKMEHERVPSRGLGSGSYKSSAAGQPRCDLTHIPRRLSGASLYYQQPLPHAG